MRTQCFTLRRRVIYPALRLRSYGSPMFASFGVTLIKGSISLLVRLRRLIFVLVMHASSLWPGGQSSRMLLSGTYRCLCPSLSGCKPDKARPLLVVCKIFTLYFIQTMQTQKMIPQIYECFLRWVQLCAIISNEFCERLYLTGGCRGHFPSEFQGQSGGCVKKILVSLEFFSSDTRIFF